MPQIVGSSTVTTTRSLPGHSGISTSPAANPENSRARWLLAHRRRVIAFDIFAILSAVLFAQWLDLGVREHLRIHGDYKGFYFAISAVIAIAWLACLQFAQSRSTRYLGSSHVEYTRVFRASIAVFIALMLVSLIFRIEELRGYLFIAAPLGTLGLLFGRWLQRRIVARRRRHGKDLYRVLLIGRPESARGLISILSRDPSHGHMPVGLCLPANSHSTALRFEESVTVGEHEIPILGPWHQIEEAIAESGACTVAVMSSESFGPADMRELSWRLDHLGVDMVVAPNLIDIDTMRITTRPVSGLPLLHIDGPRHEQANRFTKAAFDRLGSGLLLALFSPVLLVCALAVRLSSPGPVFYRQYRVGLDGQKFPMYKFRSMVVGADALIDSLRDQSEGNEVQFKMRSDPRVTPVGRVLRRYSLDELPQLFNVVLGHMSLVGPRPHVDKEVSQYDEAIARRLYVRPGMTGLWQVSGRSNLTWEESVRLDLSYVENWSLGLDLIILWRTARAVIGSDGAY